MSPPKFNHHEEVIRKGLTINGPRPSPLRIHKDSHSIQKTSSYSSSTSISSSQVKPQNHHHHHQHHQHQQQPSNPVIIYTQSPKVIHTQARDFMALVQKLTGLSRSAPRDQQPQKTCDIQGPSRNVAHDDNESSSVVTDENCSGTGTDVKESFSSPNPFFADIPLFTPNSNAFFCSPRSFFRYPDMVSSSPNMGNLASPSFLELLRGGVLPEY